MEALLDKISSIMKFSKMDDVSIKLNLPIVISIGFKTHSDLIFIALFLR